MRPFILVVGGKRKKEYRNRGCEIADGKGMHAAMIICVEERLAFCSNDFGLGINFIPMESNSLVFSLYWGGDRKFEIEFE